MNHQQNNPRSMLHALTPQGLGTPDVESLLSYFCRLSVSHSVSLSTLAQKVVGEQGHILRENFDWHERNLSGMGESAEAWAATLSALTSIGYLDQLTLLNWRNVMAPTGLAARTGRWCPDCFAEDEAAHRPPYFRLSWDIGAVTVCHKHRIPLLDVCPDCGRKGARHKASFAMPGWCTHCGFFLGTKTAEYEQSPADAVGPEALWVARQVGLLLSTHGQDAVVASHERECDAIRTLVGHFGAGKSAVFAKRMGLSKSTLHHWLKDGGVPALSASLRIAAHCGLTLPQLLAGNLDGWAPPEPNPQLLLELFPEPAVKRDAPRKLNWEEIRAELQRMARLPTPISVGEAGRQLEINDRLLYLQANKEARALGERWKQYQQRQGRNSRAVARPYLEQACREIVAEGRAISLREVEARVPKAILDRVERLFDTLHDIKEELGVS